VLPAFNVVALPAGYRAVDTVEIGYPGPVVVSPFAVADERADMVGWEMDEDMLEANCPTLPLNPVVCEIGVVATNGIVRVAVVSVPETVSDLTVVMTGIVGDGPPEWTVKVWLVAIVVNPPGQISVYVVTTTVVMYSDCAAPLTPPVSPAVTPPVSTAAIGQTVVYNSTVSVVTCPILAGQSVTVAAQDVIVYTVVAYTVEVVSDGSGETVMTCIAVVSDGEDVAV
jgi:hypothetical protein